MVRVLSSTVQRVVHSFGCTIKKGSDKEVIINCPHPAKGLDKAMASINFHRFSSAPPMGGKGRDIWYQYFEGTQAAWRQFLRTGVPPAGEAYELPRTIRLVIRL